jgi:hypothetical protein
MIPFIVNPDADHMRGYLCCEIVRSAVASVRLDGASVDAEWVIALHDVVMRERTVDQVIEAERRRHTDRWVDDGGRVGIVDY